MEKTYDDYVHHAKSNNWDYPKSSSQYDVGKWFSQRPLNIARYFKWLDKRTAKKYIYLITFTLSTDNVAKEELAEEFIREQPKRKALSLLTWVMVKEYTKKGVPHWHCVVESYKPIKKNRFEYYAKKFGFVDISRTKGQTRQEALQYISKDEEPEVLL